MKLPHWLAPYIYGIFQAGITTALATAIAVHRHQGLGMALAEEWAPAWLLSWVAAADRDRHLAADPALRARNRGGGVRARKSPAEPAGLLISRGAYSPPRRAERHR